jgi:hypothetical protein
VKVNIREEIKTRVAQNEQEFTPSKLNTLFKGHLILRIILTTYPYLLFIHLTFNCLSPLFTDNSSPYERVVVKKARSAKIAIYKI